VGVAVPKSPHDRRYMYFDENQAPQFLSPVAADAIANVYQEWLLKQPCVENSKTHGDWYEAQVDRVLRKGTDILRFNGDNRRTVEVCSFEGPRDFENVALEIRRLGKDRLLYIPQAYRSQRYFDGVLAARTPHDIYLMYFNVCAGRRHKDSSSDMEKNETLWRDQVKSWKNEWGVTFHESFLWITPTTTKDKKVVLFLDSDQTQYQRTFEQQTAPWKDLFNKRISTQAISSGHKLPRLASLHLTLTYDDLLNRLR